MKSNMNAVDVAIRCGVGMFLLSSPLLNLPTYPYNLLGIVLMVTGVAGYCPVYGAFRFLLPGQDHGAKAVRSH
jgi:hypothetical protein